NVVEMLQHHTANGVDLCITEIAAEVFVEVFDRGQSLDHEILCVQALDETVVIDIIFIFDFANDLFQYIFNGDDTAGAAILINDHSHVLMILAKFVQQHVQTLALGNKGGWSHYITNIEGFLLAVLHKAQQILGQQDADDGIHVFCHYRDRKSTRLNSSHVKISYAVFCLK